MLAAVLGGYLLAFFCAIFYRSLPRLIGYLAALGVAAISVYFFSFWGTIGAGESQIFVYEWVPSLGVDLVFYLDGLSLFFALLITIFGSLILLYSVGYMKGEAQANRFFAYILVFMASMLGLVLSGNLIQLYVFWELTSISSFLLIAYESHGEKARKAALQALLITAGGGLALLPGLILIGLECDSMLISDIIQHDLSHSSFLPAILVLVFLGTFTKSAQFPFHFWLPNAMEAPTPVSAYLHSATMVKAGVFLLLRLTPPLAGSEAWHTTLMIIGGISMLMGAFLAMVQSDLKKILAYVTISTLGLVITTIGMGSVAAIKAGIVYLLVHALYKGCLFMVAGNTDHEAGTKNIRELGGLFSKMPLTATAAILAGLSMAGAPPLLGFIAKEKLYEASMHQPVLAWILTIAFFVTSVFYVSIALVIAYGVFFGKKQHQSYEKAHEAHFSMWFGPLLLGVLGLVLGFANHALARDLLSPGISNILATPLQVEAKLWHGFNQVLLLSLFTLLCGIGIYAGRHTFERIFSFLRREYTYVPEALYFKGLKALNRLALAQTRFLQSGYLRNYLITIIAFFTLCTAYLYFANYLLPSSIPDIAPIRTSRVYEFIPVLLIGVGFFKIFTTRSRLTMLVSTGLLGFGVAAVFIFFSAPDVSITQFLVETVTLLFFMLIVHRLPKHRLLGSEPRRFLQVGVSLAFGLVMTLVLLSVESSDTSSGFKKFYLENSQTIGKGKNVVNVILVDFRALDTLGEVTVLCITALGIVAMNQLNLKQEEK